MEMNSLEEETIYLSSQREKLATTDCDVEKAGFNDKCSDHLQAYLQYCCQIVEFSKFMDDLEVRCQADYNGSLLYKYVHILVCNL